MATPFPTGVDLNFATFYKIHSEPAAIIFAVVYAPLALFYLFQAIRRPTSVSLTLSLFCVSKYPIIIACFYLSPIQPHHRLPYPLSWNSPSDFTPYTVRIASFIMRALLTTEDSIEHNKNFFIAYEIIYNVGFFALLYSAYTLVLDRSVSISLL